MKKPITLYIPDYYNQKNIDGNCMIFSKTEPLSKEYNTKTMLLASIEKTENYQCKLQYISEKDREIITSNFKSANLSLKIADCETYALNRHHFIIRWIAISEAYVLQLLIVVTKPQYLKYHTASFMRGFYKTMVDKKYDYSNISDIDKVFEVKISKEEPKENIIKTPNTQILTILKIELKEKEEAKIESFICTDWNMYYNLYNPENFSDPDSTIEWEDNSDVFDYYEKPFTDNSKVTITCYEEDFDISILEKLIENKEIVEQNLLNFFELYTFGNGGAYADAIYYKYAKIEIERLHNTTYSNQEFLKRNLCLTEIETIKSTNELKLRFACSWDTEHGIEIILNAQCFILKPLAVI
ncbi:MAG TPA: hypothetical protein EYG89_04145 [Bacteroidia bacterium]|nr:hypothetical protein [Bacteroidia bacterium]